MLPSDLLKQLADEGKLDSSGHFTLDAQTAWRKISAYKLDSPHRYGCELAAAAVQMGASRLTFQLTPDLVRVTFSDCHSDLQQLLSRPLSHPLMSGLLGAQSSYPPGSRLTLTGPGGKCQVDGGSLTLSPSGSGTDTVLELRPPRKIFSKILLNHTLVKFHLEQECRYSQVRIHLNQEEITRPWALPPHFVTLRTDSLPPFQDQARETHQLESNPDLSVVIAFPIEAGETIVSCGRTLLHVPTPGWTAWIFPREPRVDLSGNLIDEGAEYLTFVKDQLRPRLAEQLSRPDLKPQYKNPLTDMWRSLLRPEDLDHPLARNLPMARCSGPPVPLSSLQGLPQIYLYPQPEPRLEAPAFLPDPLLDMLDIPIVRLGRLPGEIRLTVAPVSHEDLSYQPDIHHIQITLPSLEHYAEVVSAARILPGGVSWSTSGPGNRLGELWLQHLLEAARQPERLEEVLAYIEVTTQRVTLAFNRLASLQRQLGPKAIPAVSPLDAVLGRVDPTLVGWFIELGTLVGWDELATLEFIPQWQGSKVSLLQLRARAHISINQAEPDSLQIPAKYAQSFARFLRTPN